MHIFKKKERLNMMDVYLKADGLDKPKADDKKKKARKVADKQKRINRKNKK